MERGEAFVSVSSCREGCHTLAFQTPYPLGEPARLALEDYARVLSRGSAAEALRADDDPAMVTGVHVCDLGVRPTRAVMDDIEGFARDMAARGTASPGLGWS